MNKFLKNPPRIHFKISEKNGTPVVLCRKAADLVWRLTEKVEEITCKHCAGRMGK